MDEHYLYLILMAASLLVPLLRSFEPRISYSSSFRPLFIAIMIVALVFLIWDIIFTHYGIWGFNERYLSGISLFGLPLGEYLFFLIIPFSCVFIYRVLNYFFPNGGFGPKTTRNISNFLIGFSAALAIVFHDRWYSLITFASLCVLVYLNARVWHSPWLGKFYQSYLVVLIPFFIVNGILTGTGIEEEVVWYNEDEMIGRRILTVPLEDIFYGMVMILAVTGIYEHLGKKWGMSYAQDTSTR